MANVSIFQFEQCVDNYKVKIEIDDVFDENSETKVKTENGKQVQYIEIDDVFDEALERKYDNNVNVDNQLTVTVKCLYKDEEDDIFDEEQEKLDETLVIGFITVGAKNKVEVDTDNGTLNESKLQENLGLSTNVVEEAGDTICTADDVRAFENKLMQNIVIDSKSFVEICEQKIKDIENEVIRTDEHSCRESTFNTTEMAIFRSPSLTCEMESSSRSERTVEEPVEVGENNINKGNGSDNENQKIVEKIVTKKFEHTRENQQEENNSNLREQSGEQSEVDVNAHRISDKTEDEEKLKKKTEIKNRKQPTEDRNQQKDDSIKSHNANYANKKKNTVPKVSNKLGNAVKTPKVLSQRINCNSDTDHIESTDTPNETKSNRKKDEKNWPVSVLNKMSDGEEKIKRLQYLKVNNGDNREKEKSQREIEYAETITLDKSTKEIAKKTAQIENNNIETQLRPGNLNDKPFDRSKYKKIDQLLETCKKGELRTIHKNNCGEKYPAESVLRNHETEIEVNSQKTIKNFVNNDTHLEDIEYCCTKCSFTTRHRAMLKTHLSQHGTQFYSGIISFLDLIPNLKAASQLIEAGEVQEEIKEQSTAETDVAIPNKTHTEVRRKLTDRVEIVSSRSVCQSIDQNGRRSVNTSENQNIDNMICRKNESVLEKIQIVQNEEVQKINKNISSGKDVEPKIDPKRSIDDQNINGEVLNKENNTICENSVTLITNKTGDKTTLKSLKSNLGSRYENRKNVTTQNQCNLTLKIKEKIESRKQNKRKRVIQTSSAAKRFKLDNDKIYQCNECPYQSHKKRYFYNHIIIHSKNVIKCDYCLFTTNLQRYMNTHMLVHLQPGQIKMHKCLHCPYQTKRRGDLTGHMIQHKKPEDLQMFQCDKCSYKTKRKANLRSHQESHKSVNLLAYSCAVCSFAAKNKFILKSHMIIHQKVEETRWYNCDQCSYSTKYKAGLSRHGLVHKNLDEIKTYDCPTCPYKAKHKSHLKSHILIHKDPNEVEMHRCDHCPYMSISKSNLLAHMVKHKKTGEINMKKCEHCSYQTKLKCNLIKHINRIHG